MCNDNTPATISGLYSEMEQYCKFPRLIHYIRRNSERNRTYYYYGFIYVLWKGGTKWKDVADEYKAPWEAAKNSFDAMYGLLGAWKNMEAKDFKAEEVKEPIKAAQTTANIEELTNLAYALNRLDQALLKLYPGDDDGNRRLDNLAERLSKVKDISEKLSNAAGGKQA